MSLTQQLHSPFAVNRAFVISIASSIQRVMTNGVDRTSNSPVFWQACALKRLIRLPGVRARSGLQPRQSILPTSLLICLIDNGRHK